MQPLTFIIPYSNKPELVNTNWGLGPGKYKLRAGVAKYKLEPGPSKKLRPRTRADAGTREIQIPYQNKRVAIIELQNENEQNVISYSQLRKSKISLENKF